MNRFLFLQYILALCSGMSCLTVITLQYRMMKTPATRDLFFYTELCLFSILIYGIGTYSTLFGLRVPSWYQSYSTPIFFALACVRFVFLARMALEIVGIRARSLVWNACVALFVAAVYSCAYALFVSACRDDSSGFLLSFGHVFRDFFVVIPVFCLALYLLVKRRGIHGSIYRLWVALTVGIIAPVILFVILFVASPTLCGQCIDLPMIVFFLSNSSYTAFYVMSTRRDSFPGTVSAPSRMRHEDLLQSWGISKREYEIIILVSEGHSYAKIAELLFISPNTVRNHISNAYRKLGIENKVQLMKALYSGSK